MSQNKNAEQNFWDECAKERVYAAFDKEEYGYIFNKTIGNIEGKKVLDIGCASGISAVLLGLRGGDVVGIDISPELIKQAKDLSKNIDVNVEFTVGDAENLKFTDGSIDIVFFGGVIHHFPQKIKLINECFRVLKKGGKFLAIEPNCNDFFQRLNWKIARKRKLLSVNEDLINPLRLKNLLDNNGFKIIQLFTFREHLSFLGMLFPKLRKFFEEHGETASIERILLFPVNLFRKKISRGNFFVIYGEKK